MKLFLLILIAIGVTIIFDARKITKNYFGKQDQNKTVTILKVVGFVICVVCGVGICFIK